jgi:putative FmdB family regulatory protein
MPIYAYKCESCGFAKDVLQKMSDAPLEVCPACSQSTFKKQLTAAGFQLKGSGWYATDFKSGGTASPNTAAPADSGGGPVTPATTEAVAPKPEAAKAGATPPSAGATTTPSGS